MLAAVVEDQIGLGDLACGKVKGRIINPMLAGQAPGQIGRLMNRAAARPMAFEFVQTDQVAAIDGGGDVVQVLYAVATDAG